MNSKIFEIRDKGTTIIALVTQLRPSCEVERALLAHAGYSRTPEDQAKYFLVTTLNGGETHASYDPFGWKHYPGWTMREAHLYLQSHWDDLDTGAVICTEYLRGERATPKTTDFAGVEA
jgi:hypothetical protein